MSYKTAMIIQALKTLGKDHVKDTDISLLRKQLTIDEKTTLLKDPQQTIIWIYEKINLPIFHFIFICLWSASLIYPHMKINKRMSNTSVVR